MSSRWMYVDMQNPQSQQALLAIQERETVGCVQVTVLGKHEALSQLQAYLHGSCIASYQEVKPFCFKEVLPDGQTHLPWCHSCKTTGN